MKPSTKRTHFLNLLLTVVKSDIEKELTVKVAITAPHVNKNSLKSFSLTKISAFRALKVIIFATRSAPVWLRSRHTRFFIRLESHQNACKVLQKTCKRLQSKLNEMETR